MLLPLKRSSVCDLEVHTCDRGSFHCIKLMDALVSWTGAWCRGLLIIGDYDRPATQRSKMSCLYCCGDKFWPKRLTQIKSDVALRCRCNPECASGRFQRAWLGGRRSDSWSSMVSCLTHSTTCSSGQLAALLPPKTCMASRTPGGRGVHLRA